MNRRVQSILFYSAIMALIVLLAPPHGISQDKRWVYFSYDKNQAGTDYFYDRETVAFTGQNRVSAWMKVVSSGSEELIHVEIECFGKMFRTITGYTPFLGKQTKDSYVAYGWLEIPPDSEIYLLSKIVCKPPAKD